MSPSRPGGAGTLKRSTARPERRYPSIRAGSRRGPRDAAGFHRATNGWKPGPAASPIPRRPTTSGGWPIAGQDRPRQPHPRSKKHDPPGERSGGETPAAPQHAGIPADIHGDHPVGLEGRGEGSRDGSASNVPASMRRWTRARPWIRTGPRRPGTAALARAAAPISMPSLSRPVREQDHLSRVQIVREDADLAEPWRGCSKEAPRADRAIHPPPGRGAGRSSQARPAGPGGGEGEQHPGFELGHLRDALLHVPANSCVVRRDQGAADTPIRLSIGIFPLEAAQNTQRRPATEPSGPQDQSDPRPRPPGSIGTHLRLP